MGEVSMASEGYPKCFNSPGTKTEQPLPKGDAEEDPKEKRPLSEGEPTQPSFVRRKLGQALPAQRNDETFTEQMGLVAKNSRQIEKTKQYKR